MPFGKPPYINNETGMASKSSADDLGLRAIREIYQRAMIDEQWSLWEERGFSWWGHRLRQRIWAEPGVESDGFEIFRICAQTDCLCEVEITDKLLGALGLIAREATVAAPVLDPDSRTLSLFSCVYVHEEIFNWAVHNLFVPSILIQVIEAERMAEAGPEVFETGTPDYSGHPSSGFRRKPDDTLRFIDRVIRPVGEMTRRWRNCRELPRVAEILNQTNCVASNGGGVLTAEFSFGNDTCLFQIDANAEHRLLGNGALVTLRLPMQWDFTVAARAAAAWNRAESRTCTFVSFLGSWAVEELGSSFCPMFVSFSPSAVYGDGLALNLALMMASRARWAAKWFNLPETDVKDLFTKRLLEFLPPEGRA